MDLEGVVVKYKFGAYGEAWFKRVNPNYSQHRGWYAPATARAHLHNR